MDSARGSRGVAPRRAKRGHRGTPAESAEAPRRRTIVHLSAEYYPYARTGGLAEAVAGLAKFQTQAGQRVVVFLPLYSSVREVTTDLEPLGPTRLIPMGARLEEVRFFRERTAPGTPEVIFVDSPGYFQREGLYGEHGADYPDNHRRFALFSRAALEGIHDLAPGPTLLHVHDWHAALAPVYLRTSADLGRRFGPAPVVVSVHNAGYQGHFPESTLEELGLPWELWTPERIEWYGRLNMLKGALKFCDAAVTVSPTHAAELCTPEGGFGLHDSFRDLGSQLFGICNGIDQGVWDPATDDQIAATYSADDLAGKVACKWALQRAFGLPERPDVPLFGMTGRLVEQKGFDIVLRSERLRSLDAQFIFLGKGDPWYQAELAARAAERPQHIAVEFAFTDALEHRLTSGSDIVLMPSLYEPCGLTQMRAQRYGAPVVARNVGGIHDTVEDNATGFLFDAFEAQALDAAIDRALDRFTQRRRWTAMMRRAMQRDFGWERSAALYAEVYDAASRVVAAPA